MKKTFLDELKDKINSKSFKKILKKEQLIEKNLKIIKNNQVLNLRTRIKSNVDFEKIIEKVILKYNSSAYKEKWFKRSMEPPEDLLWLIFNYAEKYGRECTKKEIKKYGNMFTSKIFFIHNYYIQRIDGQGSAILVQKNDKSAI